MIPSQILPVHRLTKVPSLCFINRLAGVPGNLSFRETLRVRAQESDPERAHNYVRTDFIIVAGSVLQLHQNMTMFTG